MISMSPGFQGARTTGIHSWGVLQEGSAWSQHAAPGVILESFPGPEFLALFPWRASQPWSPPYKLRIKLKQLGRCCLPSGRACGKMLLSFSDARALCLSLEV